MKISEIEKQQQVVIYMTQATPVALDKIKQIIEKNPGNAQVYLQVGTSGAGKRIKTRSQIRINPALAQELRAIPEISKVGAE